MMTDEIIPILEGLDEYNMTEVSFQITACNLLRCSDWSRQLAYELWLGFFLVSSSYSTRDKNRRMQNSGN